MSKFIIKDKKINNSNIELTVQIPEKVFATFTKSAKQNLAQKLKVSGFRQGHIPDDIIDQHISKTDIDVQAGDILLKEFYPAILTEAKVAPITPPEIEIKGMDPFSFTIKIDVLPEIKLTNWEQKAQVKLTKPSVSKKEITELELKIKEDKSVFIIVKRAAKDGDRVELDFTGFWLEDQDQANAKKGTEIANTASKHHLLLIGLNTFIPGFEQKIIGLGAGEDKSFNITFPSDYRAENLKGKKVEFRVHIHKVEEKKLAKIDEKLIESIEGKKMSVADFKDKLKNELLASKELKSRDNAEKDALDKLIKLAGLTNLPQSIVAKQLDLDIEQFTHYLQSKGMSIEHYLQATNSDLTKYRESMKPKAERSVKEQLILSHLLQTEKIIVSENDFKEELEKLLQKIPQTQFEEAKKFYTDPEHRNQLEQNIRVRKIFNRLIK